MSQYINKRDVQKSYRPTAGTMSPGLKRAREPYRLKNAIVGLALGAFAAGVWAYSISAVKQDVFDDVDEEAKALASKGAAAGSGALGTAPVSIKEDENKKEKKERDAPIVAAATVVSDVPVALVAVENIVVSEPLPAPVEPAAPAVPPSASAKGVLQGLGARWPRLLDPESRTLVWGAPSVDNVGKMGKP